MVGVCSKAQIRCGLLLNEYPAAHFNSEVAWAVMGMIKLLCMHTRDDVTLCQEYCSAQAGPVAQARDLFNWECKAPSVHCSHDAPSSEAVRDIFSVPCFESHVIVT